MTTKELQAEVERLQAQLAAAERHSKITFKVSTKGAVSVYGLGRFPVTLYKEQWRRLMTKSTELLGFITDNESLLSTK